MSKTVDLTTKDGKDLRKVKKCVILLSCDGKSTAYGVTGLVDPLERVIPLPLPMMVEMVLLPFRRKLTYGGIVSSFNVMLDPGSRRGFLESF